MLPLYFLKTIKQNIAAFSVIIVFVLIGLAFSLGFDKNDLQLQINILFHPVGNLIFGLITRLAEGWFTFPLLVFLFIKNWRKGLYVGLAYGVSSLVVQILKQVVFTGYEYNRPLGTPVLFKNPDYQWLSEELPKYNSFPSGHTTTAFCIFLALAIITPNKKWGAVYMFIAALVGFSRTYLSCHFVKDITAGAFLGAITSLALYFALKKPLKLN